MKPVQRTVYEAHDGKLFETAAECRKYEELAEQKAKQTTYWAITNRPDLTEGRGWYGLILVECYGPARHDAEGYMLDYCFNNLGRPIAFVQGASPVRNWMLRPIEREYFDRADHSTHVGDHAYEAQRIKLVVCRESGGSKLIDAIVAKKAES